MKRVSTSSRRWTPSRASSKTCGSRSKAKRICSSPAGSFATYKVRVKRGDGETILYVKKELPHLMIKQEIPAQQLAIELKSLEM